MISRYRRTEMLRNRRNVARSIHWVCTLTGTFAAVLSAAGAAWAQPARFYYAGPGQDGIRQANLDGTAAAPLVDERRAQAVNFADLKADGSRVYWADPLLDRVGAVSLDGSQVYPALIDLRPIGAGISPRALAIQGGYIYFAWSPRLLATPTLIDDTVTAIGRAKLDGTDIQLDFIPPSQTPQASSLATDSAHIYWADAIAGRIGRARLDGSEVQPSFITGLPVDASQASLKIAVGRDYVYWSYPAIGQASAGIGRAKLDGTDVRRPFRRVFRAGSSLAVDGDYLFWGYFGSGLTGRMNLDGSDIFTNFEAPAPGLIAVPPRAPTKPTARCTIGMKSVARGDTLIASCHGVSGRVTVTVAGTIGAGAASPPGLLDLQQRLTRTVHRGRLAISTQSFCRDRYLTDRYRILFTRNGYENVGAATIRLRSTISQTRCRPMAVGING